MEQVIGEQKVDAFRAIGFSDKVRRCLDRAIKAGLEIQTISFADARWIIEHARKELALASDDAISRIVDRNPDVLRAVVRTHPERKILGLFAYLPLNSEGFEGLVQGRLSGIDPNPYWITRPNETPEAIYLWLVYLPGALAQSIGIIGPAFNTLVPQGCPVFSKAVTDHAERLNRAMGFMAARDFYPEAADGLLVVFPERGLPKRTASDPYDIRIARHFEDMFKVLSIRSATYLAEQFCHYAEEFDGNDFCATHMLGHVDGDPAGCVRIRFFADFAKIERLAVRSEYRNSKLAFALARRAVDHCHAKGYRTIYGHSRLDLVRFWRVFGFREMPNRPDFTFANIKYRELILEAERRPSAIGLHSGPMTLIRPEGAWDRPGPLDISASERDPRRHALIGSRLRTVNGQEARA